MYQNLEEKQRVRAVDEAGIGNEGQVRVRVEASKHSVGSAWFFLQI